MGRSKKPYVITKPRQKGGTYRFRTPSHLDYMSTGKKSYREAVLFCEAWLKESQKATLPLRDYAKDFYIENKCPFYTPKYQTGKRVDLHTLHDERARLENYIFPAFGDLPIKELTAAHWERWIEDVKSGKILTMGNNPHLLADGTINRIRRTLIQILDIAVRYKDLQENEIRKTEAMSQKTYKPRDPLSDDDLAKLFPNEELELLAIWGSHEYIALYKLLLTSGLRSGEVIALRWRNFSDKGIIVDNAVKYDKSIGTTKNGETRTINLPDDTIASVITWKGLTRRNSDNDFLFYNRKGNNHARGDSILKHFQLVLARNGIDSNKNLVIHSFRHTFVTDMAEKLPISVVMEYSGHKSIQMIKRYTHPDYDKQLKEMNKKNKKQINQIWGNRIGASKKKESRKRLPRKLQLLPSKEDSIKDAS